MGNSANKRIVATPELQYFTSQIFADMLESPNNANWKVGNIATLEADLANNAMLIRAFDDTTEEGVGFSLYVPTYATGLAIRLVSRARVAPGTAKNVVPRLYLRGIPDNAAVESWSVSAYDLTALSIPTNLYFQYDTQTIALSDLGITKGRVYQFELTRKTSGVTDNLVNDWYLMAIEVGFTAQ